MQVLVLGSLDVRDGARAVAVPGGRSRIVLAVLALHANKIVSQERLIDAAWGADEPATARTQLQGMVSGLRRCLTAGAAQAEAGAATVAITTHGPAYRLEIPADRLDLQRFQLLADRARASKAVGHRRAAAETMREALDLWRGPAFEGLNSDYLAAERGFLDEVRLAAIETYADAQLELGNHADVLDELARAAEANQLHEGMAARMILALHRCGRQADALAAYRRIRRRLIDELGIEPSEDLQLLQRRILTGDWIGAATEPASAAGAAGTGPESGPAGVVPGRGPDGGPAAGFAFATDSVPSPAQLVPDIADFVGRQDQVGELQDYLRTGRKHSEYGRTAAVAVIAGMAGIGKTALAVHAAHGLRGDFADGQLYLDLGATGPAPLDTAAALGRLLGDLGVARANIPDGVGARAGLYRSLVADRRVLIILDDAGDTASVRYLLPGTSSCSVVVTSRNRLAGLAGVRRVALAKLSFAESRGLLAANAGVDRVEADPGALHEILAVCEGLPLAVRIAGTRLAMRPEWTLADLADRLGDPCLVLGELVADDLSVHAAVESSVALLAASNCQLDLEAARTFRFLGAWNGEDIGLGAAAAFLGSTEHETESWLERLVDVHLLESTAGRYRLHGLVRAVGRRHAEHDLPASSRRAAAARLALWYIAVMQAATAVLAWDHPGHGQDPQPGDRPSPDGPDEAVLWCEREWQSMIVAGRAAREYGLEDLALRVWRSARAITASRTASGRGARLRVRRRGSERWSAG